MFGHGQVEGFHEKYGMEFRKPKWDETPDAGLIAGHDWKIFPILHRRNLFADVENFLLYDFYRADPHAGAGGAVDENVFAYSNVHGDERGIVVYHNRFADTRGWIKVSAAYLDKNTGDLRQKSLAEGLGLPFDGYVIFTDYVTHLEYIRSCEELWQKGLYLDLHAYQHHVFMDWRFVDDEKWSDIYVALNGVGVESVQAKWDEMFGVKEEVVEEVKAKKPRKKVVAAKSKKKEVKSSPKKGAVRKTVAKISKPVKKVADKAVAVTKKVTSTKPKVATTKPKATAKKTTTKTSSTKSKPAAKKVVVRKTTKMK
jgi:hypothetical protein